jgi:hypothetical protein
LSVIVGDKYGLEVDMYLENITAGVISCIKELTHRVYLYNAANSFFLYSDTNAIDADATDTGGAITGPLAMHFAHSPIRFNDAAANWGTSSNQIVRVKFYANAGDSIRFGYSNPRLVKLN